MNAQLNSTNFQQFVKDNQGKKITFIHNDKQVSKVVQDVCGEYFTGKNKESDAKIDGFYYFSDCKRIEEEHPLIDVLEKHKVATLLFTNGLSSMFKYDKYDTYEYCIDGTCLTASQPLCFHPDSIKEAWAVVYGKYTKVWEKEPSQAPVSSKPMVASYFEAQNSVKNACEKVNNTLEKLNNAFDKVFPKAETHKDGPFEESHANGNLKRMGEYKNGKLHGIYQEWYDTGKLSLYVEHNEGELHGKYIVHSEDGTIRCYNIVKDGIRVSVDVGNHNDFLRPCRLSPFLREFLGLKEDIKYVRKEITEKVIKYCMQHVNPKDKTKIIPDDKIYNLIGGEFGKQITFFDLQRILDKHFLNDDTQTKKDKDILETLKHNKYVTVKTKSKVWKNFTFNSIEGRFVLGDCEGTPTVIPLNNIIAVEPADNIDEEQYKLIKEHAKMFIDISYDLGGYAPNTINKFLNKLLFIKERDFSLEQLIEFRAIFEELKDELIPQIKKLFKTDPTFQALMKRFVEFSLLILTENSVHKDNVKKLLENVNKAMTEAGRQEYNEWFNSFQKECSQKNIKYRGKPKTIEIVNEYTLDNGKEYVMVKDVTDNGKTKTLFKEYIEWM